MNKENCSLKLVDEILLILHLLIFHLSLRVCHLSAVRQHEIGHDRLHRSTKWQYVPVALTYPEHGGTWLHRNVGYFQPIDISQTTSHKIWHVFNVTPRAPIPQLKFLLLFKVFFEFGRINRCGIAWMVPVVTGHVVTARVVPRVAGVCTGQTVRRSAGSLRLTSNCSSRQPVATPLVLNTIYYTNSQHIQSRPLLQLLKLPSVFFARHCICQDMTCVLIQTGSLRATATEGVWVGSDVLYLC